MRKVFIALLISIAAALPLNASDQLADVVAANYPANLTAAASPWHYADAHQQAFVPITTPTAHYIVAAYSNGDIGAVLLLLKGKNGAYTVVDKANDFIFGKNPTVESIDIERNGVQEAMVTLENGRASASTWIYGIASGKLALLNPLDDDGVSALVLPYMVDLGNPALDLVDHAKVGEPSTLTTLHYVFVKGKYIAAPPLDFYSVYFPTPVFAKQQLTSEFSIAPSLIGRAFQLVIVNGGGCTDPCCRAQHLTITLNGIKVGSGNEVEERRMVTIPVSLQQDNTLKVDFGTNDGEKEQSTAHSKDDQSKCTPRVAILVQHE